MLDYIPVRTPADFASAFPMSKGGLTLETLMPSLLLQAMIHNNGVSCCRASQTRFVHLQTDTNKPEQNTKTKIMREKRKRKSQSLSSPSPLDMIANESFKNEKIGKRLTDLHPVLRYRFILYIYV